MIYSIRRFSEEDNQNKKSHALRNTLIGAGALAGGILAGRAGYLGTGVQRGIGKGITSVGSMFGSNKMMQSGFKTQAKAATTNAMNNAKKAMENTPIKINNPISIFSKTGIKMMKVLILDKFRIKTPEEKQYAEYCKELKKTKAMHETLGIRY